MKKTRDVRLRDRKEYHKRYYQENKEKKRIYSKKYYQEHREEMDRNSKKHRNENMEKTKRYFSEYYRKNREKYLEYGREWAKNNPEKRKEHRTKYYRKFRNKFFSMYGGKCACCGEETREFLCLDHIKGQKGKKNQNSSAATREAIKKYNPKKIRILCYNCNMSLGFLGYCPHGGLDK